MTELKPCPFLVSLCSMDGQIIGYACKGECAKCPAEDAKDREIERLKEALHSILQNAEFWDNEDDSLAIIHRIATDAIGTDNNVPTNATDTGKMEEK